MMTITVDNRQIQANEGDTILNALQKEGFDVPTLCFMENLIPSGACRMCVIEVEGMPNLVPSCAHPISEGMRIKTKSPRVIEARRTILELLLSDHPDDCLYCSRSGTCQLQKFSQEFGVKRRIHRDRVERKGLDVSSPSIVRDSDKCILCGKCVRVCEEIQSVSAINFIDRGAKLFVGTVFNQGLNISSCVNCGQCIMVCPTGSLTEKSSVEEVLVALSDPTKRVVVQHAPAVSVTIAEEFGIQSGEDYDGKMVAALRRMGFDWVFDTSFTADLTIMEEASELVHRIKNGGVLPMMTSCSPGWIKFVEQFYPEFIPNLSSCKSPQQMMGTLIKSYFAEKNGMSPESIVSVSIMPCTAKKFEASRPEMGRNHISDIDYVLTTRELGRIMKLMGINLDAIEPESPDSPFGERSSAGKIFGATGGVMEAAIRTAYYMLTGNDLETIDVKEVRGLMGRKTATVVIGGLTMGAAVVSSLGQARQLLDEIKAGRNDIHFIEVMTCPGGCLNGGGQPHNADSNDIKARLNALYGVDTKETLRLSHRNQWVQRLYKEFLGQPLSEKSHHYLHTHYHKRDVLL